MSDQTAEPSELDLNDLPNMWDGGVPVSADDLNVPEAIDADLNTTEPAETEGTAGAPEDDQ